MPVFQKLLRQHGSVVLDYCRYKVPWRKTTRLLSCHTDLSALGTHRCHLRGNCCGFTNRPHQQLIGWCHSEGKLWTSVASPYPVGLARDAAVLMLR